MTLKPLSKLLYEFQENVDPEWAKFTKKHIDFCDRFDALENSSKEEAMRLAQDLLEEYGELFYNLRRQYD